jgi:hypothetical protein
VVGAWPYDGYDPARFSHQTRGFVIVHGRSVAGEFVERDAKKPVADAILCSC